MNQALVEIEKRKIKVCSVCPTCGYQMYVSLNGIGCQKCNTFVSWELILEQSKLNKKYISNELKNKVFYSLKEIFSIRFCAFLWVFIGMFNLIFLDTISKTNILCMCICLIFAGIIIFIKEGKNEI